MRNIFKDLIHLFFPDLCAVCGNKLIDGEHCICIGCMQKLPRTHYYKQPENRLEEFFAGRVPFQRAAAYAYFIHGGSVQQMTHELKYRRNREIGLVMGELCGNELKNSDFAATLDLIVPVPLHRKRIRQRGYNQSLEICKGISKQTMLPLEPDSLVRTVNNKSQAKSKRFDRWKNVENIFEVTDKNTFIGKHILLVDDIITTGSTIESCARELLECEGCKVSIYAFGVAT